MLLMRLIRLVRLLSLAAAQGRVAWRSGFQRAVLAGGRPQLRLPVQVPAVVAAAVDRHLEGQAAVLVADAAAVVVMERCAVSGMGMGTLHARRQTSAVRARSIRPVWGAAQWAAQPLDACRLPGELHLPDMRQASVTSGQAALRAAAVRRSQLPPT